jgi:hypothetical protein
MSLSLSAALMLTPWTAFCRVHRQHIRISVSQPCGLEVLQARLPLPPAHPRAVLELLESLARHCGHSLDAVISAASRSETFFDERYAADALQLGPSALVRVIFASPNGRQLRLAPESRRVR